MGKTHVIHAKVDGELSGVRVIGFHGEFDVGMTPARFAPVYVDADNCLLRIVEVHPAKATGAGDGQGYDVRVEIAHPPLSDRGELPGYGTRVGPWLARLEDHVILLGPSEIRQARRLKPPAMSAEPPTVEKFIRWLPSNQATRPDGITCQRLDLVKAVVWYCSKAESSALWERIQRMVEEELFKAVTSGNRDAIELVSWWLSRAAVTQQDIFLAAAGLRRVASPTWKVMIREGLRLPDEKDWHGGLEDAEWLLDHPPPVESQKMRIGPELSSSREDVRNTFKKSRVA